MLGGLIINDVPKGVAFRVRFLHLDSTTPVAASVITGETTWTVLKVSKDDGAFNNCTNPTVELANGWYYVELTSTEMNADNVILHISKAGKPIQSFWIRTTSAVGSSAPTAEEVAEAVWENETRSLTGASGDAVSMEDTIEEKADLPTGDLTVRQVFQLIAKRLKRSKTTGKI